MFRSTTFRWGNAATIVFGIAFSAMFFGSMLFPERLLALVDPEGRPGARRDVEIGLAYGSSALAIGEALLAQGHRDTRHMIIDSFQHLFYHAGWDVITPAGLSTRCTLLTERSQIALPRLLAEHFVTDAAFVDGSHIFYNVFVDLYFPARTRSSRRADRSR